MGKRVLVTGGAGFIGSHITDHLIEGGHSVTVLDDLSGGLEENINPNAKFIKGSINNKELVDNLMPHIDLVYHLAAYAAEGLSIYNPIFNYMNNVMGSINLISTAVNNNIERFVFTSSMAVYGGRKTPFNEEDIPIPEDPYGIAKRTVEQHLSVFNKNHGLDYVIIRPHNVYGEKQFLGDPYRNVIGIWMNRIMQGKPPLIYGDGKQTRAFSYIGDIAPCIVEAGFREEAKSQIINLGAGKPYALNYLAEEVIKAMNQTMSPIHTEPRKEVKHAYCTTEKSERILGFKDRTSLQEGLYKMAQWAKSRGPMSPIVWEDYEIKENLPEFWLNLRKDFPDAEKRINPFVF